jgi:TctA family transporter
MLLGFILGPLMEENLLRALLISRGDPSVFFTRPISLAFLVLAFASLLIVVLPAVRKKRDEAFQGDE